MLVVEHDGDAEFAELGGVVAPISIGRRFGRGPSGPAAVRRARRRSAALRASGPSADMWLISLGPACGPGTWNPVGGTMPAPGLRPYTPQKLAGIRIEPTTRSDPYSRLGAASA